jgi:NADPH-dependent 2,4-dienoyl-CoA reductase/sulfur reductase-like enzyme
MRLLIIGGSDAGIAVALRTREVNPETEVTVVVADAYPTVARRRSKSRAINILTGHTARRITPTRGPSRSQTLKVVRGRSPTTGS